MKQKTNAQCRKSTMSKTIFFIDKTDEPLEW